MEINGTEVSSSTGTNLAYKAHLDVLLGTSKDVKIEKLKDTMLYFDEEVGAADVNQKVNGGSFAKKQLAFTKKGGRFIRTPLFIDHFQCSRYIPPDVTLKVTFYKNEEAFCLIQHSSNAKKYKLVVKDMVIMGKRIKANPERLNEHENFYDQQLSAYLPITYTSLNYKVAGKGTSNVLLENITLGGGGGGDIVPFKTFMVIVPHDSYNGDLSKNPLQYKHYNLKGLEFHISGKSYPATRYNFDWTKGDVLSGYFNLMKGIGAGGDHISPNITLDAYMDHATIFCLDHAPDDCCGTHTHIPMSGLVHAELNFSSELLEPVTVIFYSFYKKLLKFTRPAKDFPPAVEIVHHI